jgi:hypothetical protein
MSQQNFFSDGKLIFETFESKVAFSCLIFFLFGTQSQWDNFIGFGIILKSINSLKGSTEWSVKILCIDDESKRIDISQSKEAELFFAEGIDKILEELFFSFLNFVNFLVVSTKIIQAIIQGRKIRTEQETLSG